MTKTNVLTGLLILALLFCAYSFITVNQVAKASDATQIPASWQTNGATTTTPTLSPDVNVNAVIFATSSCAARIISNTGASAILLSFNGATVTPPLAGVLQAASTTVVYDAGQYGCGRVKAYSYVQQTITAIETR